MGLKQRGKVFLHLASLRWKVLHLPWWSQGVCVKERQRERERDDWSTPRHTHTYTKSNQFRESFCKQDTSIGFQNFITCNSTPHWLFFVCEIRLHCVHKTVYLASKHLSMWHHWCVLGLTGFHSNHPTCHLSFLQQTNKQTYTHT